MKSTTNPCKRYAETQYHQVLAGRFAGPVAPVLGCCPQCNSDAPETFSCDVCAYGGVPDRYWQDRWLDKLRAKYL